MSEPVPINAPSRKELWRRIRVAESILGHRPILPASTRDLLLAVLRGDEVAVTESRGVS